MRWEDGDEGGGQQARAIRDEVGVLPGALGLRVRHYQASHIADISVYACECLTEQ